MKKATMEGLISSETKIRALIVDDDKTNQIVHRRFLLSLGVENMVVGNGKEAIDVHCSGNTFDLILMDLDMPIMDGIEATRNLRAMGIRSRIAGVSSRSVDEKVKEFLDAGLNEYVQKPLSVGKLVTILKKVNHNG